MLAISEATLTFSDLDIMRDAIEYGIDRVRNGGAPYEMREKKITEMQRIKQAIAIMKSEGKALKSGTYCVAINMEAK